uniref:Uncharacterized protein n=1 Tax=Varanus komodoensis TaxID=61221 RepID=A0A8D2KYF2_VARKO
VRNNRISLEGALCLALGLKENKTLRILGMARNPIQNDGCVGILKAVRANSAAVLEILDFSVGINQWVGQRDMLPSLRIKHDGTSRLFRTDSSKVWKVNLCWWERCFSLVCGMHVHPLVIHWILQAFDII